MAADLTTQDTLNVGGIWVKSSSIVCSSLDKVTVNTGGTLKTLNAVYTNSGGVLNGIFAPSPETQSGSVTPTGKTLTLVKTPIPFKVTNWKVTVAVNIPADSNKVLTGPCAVNTIGSGGLYGVKLLNDAELFGGGALTGSFVIPPGDYIFNMTCNAWSRAVMWILQFSRTLDAYSSGSGGITI